jgi:uncharacterized protein (DUF169 family)
MSLFTHPPVGIAFLNDPPEGLEKWTAGEVPAGCSFWRYAFAGRSFYTEQSDHYNCAVGAHTHGITLPPNRAGVLGDTVGFMVEQGYIEMAEVPGIPVLPKAPNYVAYGPVASAPFSPDLVLLALKPYAAMLLYEAAVRVDAAQALSSILGRPGCAVLPLAMNSGTMSLSFGCKGNRTFTGLPAEDLYACVSGSKWEAVETYLTHIERANEAMEKYYQAHQAKFPIIA